LAGRLPGTDASWLPGQGRRAETPRRSRLPGSPRPPRSAASHGLRAAQLLTASALRSSSRPPRCAAPHGITPGRPPSASPLSGPIRLIPGRTHRSAPGPMPGADHRAGSLRRTPSLTRSAPAAYAAELDAAVPDARELTRGSIPATARCSAPDASQASFNSPGWSPTTSSRGPLVLLSPGARFGRRAPPRRPGPGSRPTNSSAPNGCKIACRIAGPSECEPTVANTCSPPPHSPGPRPAPAARALRARSPGGRRSGARSAWSSPSPPLPRMRRTAPPTTPSRTRTAVLCPATSGSGAPARCRPGLTSASRRWRPARGAQRDAPHPCGEAAGRRRPLGGQQAIHGSPGRPRGRPVLWRLRARRGTQRRQGAQATPGVRRPPPPSCRTVVAWRDPRDTKRGTPGTPRHLVARSSQADACATRARATRTGATRAQRTPAGPAAGTTSPHSRRGRLRAPHPRTRPRKRHEPPGWAARCNE